MKSFNLSSGRFKCFQSFGDHAIATIGNASLSFPPYELVFKSQTFLFLPGHFEKYIGPFFRQLAIWLFDNKGFIFQKSDSRIFAVNSKATTPSTYYSKLTLLRYKNNKLHPSFKIIPFKKDAYS